MKKITILLVMSFLLISCGWDDDKVEDAKQAIKISDNVDIIEAETKQVTEELTDEEVEAAMDELFNIIEE